MKKHKIKTTREGSREFDPTQTTGNATYIANDDESRF